MGSPNLKTTAYLKNKHKMRIQLAPARKHMPPPSWGRSLCPSLCVKIPDCTVACVKDLSILLSLHGIPTLCIFRPTILNVSTIPSNQLLASNQKKSRAEPYYSFCGPYFVFSFLHFSCNLWSLHFLFRIFLFSWISDDCCIFLIFVGGSAFSASLCVSWWIFAFCQCFANSLAFRFDGFVPGFLHCSMMYAKFPCMFSVSCFRPFILSCLLESQDFLSIVLRVCLSLRWAGAEIFTAILQKLKAIPA